MWITLFCCWVLRGTAQSSVPEMLYDSLVRTHVLRIYMNGPSFGAHVGGWGGKTNPEICAFVTGQPEMFWVGHDDACAELIDRRFSASLVTVETVAYFFVLFRAFQAFNSLAWMWFSSRIPQNRRPLPIVTDGHF